jgi:hypothetical protein
MPSLARAKPPADAPKRHRRPERDQFPSLRTPRVNPAERIPEHHPPFLRRWDKELTGLAFRSYKPAHAGAIVISETSVQADRFDAVWVRDGSDDLYRIGGWPEEMPLATHRCRPAEQFVVIIAGKTEHFLYTVWPTGKALAFAAKIAGDETCKALQAARKEGEMPANAIPAADGTFFVELPNGYGYQLFRQQD